MITWYIVLMFLIPMSGFLLMTGMEMIKPSGLSDKMAASLCILNFNLLLILSLCASYFVFINGAQTISMGPWLRVGSYVFELRFIVDKLACAFLLSSSFLFLTISFFSRTYLHAETGALKFYILLLLFAAGTNLVALSDSIDIFFAGWELVGYSSVLLIGYFSRRTQPIVNALKVFRIYKICDVALLTAAIWLHVFFHQTSLTNIPDHGTDKISLIACLLLFASLGKSAQFPFSNWLRHAIEGPTPSSTIFYGSISTHLGVFLLLRSYPLLEQSKLALGLMFAIGLLSAVYATIVGRVQPDIKSSLAYSTVAQIGFIYMEISLGFVGFALIHTVLHMFYRTYQFLWSPSIIDEHNAAEMESGVTELITGKQYMKLSPGIRKKLYFLALHRFHVELLGYSILQIIGAFFDLLLAQEEKWIRKFEGDK